MIHAKGRTIYIVPIITGPNPLPAGKVIAGAGRNSNGNGNAGGDEKGTGGTPTLGDKKAEAAASAKLNKQLDELLQQAELYVRNKNAGVARALYSQVILKGPGSSQAAKARQALKTLR